MTDLIDTDSLRNLYRDTAQEIPRPSRRVAVLLAVHGLVLTIALGLLLEWMGP